MLKCGIAVAVFGTLARLGTKGELDLPFLGLCILAILALTVAHELAHAIAARAVGLRIHAIRIGSGRVAYRFHVFRTRIEVCPLFIAGGACFMSHPGEPARWRVAVCMGAPLVMHAALVPVSILWSWPIVVVLLNAFDLCVNSYPSVEDDGIPSDGAQLLLLWINEDDRDSWRVSAVYWPIQFALAEGRHEEAFRAAERAVAHYPQFDDIHEAYVTAAIRTGRFRTAHEVAANREWVLDDDDEPTRETAVLGAVSPSNQARVRLVEIYLAMGQFGLAEDEAQRAANAAANEEERCRFEASIALARVLAGETSERGESYARMPWLPDALYAHVVQKLEAGRPTEAQVALRQAENRNRFDGEEGTRAALEAAVLSAMGERRQAQRRLDAARRSNARPFAIHYAER